MLQLESSLNIAGIKSKIKENEKETTSEDFWNDPKSAQKVIKANNILKNLVENYTDIAGLLDSLYETVDELGGSYDQELFELVEQEYNETIKKFSNFEILVLLSHDYDQNNAII